MKSIYIVMAILSSVAMVTMGTHQVYAPRTCGSCVDFKTLTTQFQKDVIDAASVSPPDPDRMQTLLDEYYRNVMMIFGLERPDETEPSEDDDEPRTPSSR